MLYTKESRITTIDDAKEFFGHLVNERRLVSILMTDLRIMCQRMGVRHFLRKSAPSTTVLWMRVLRFVKRTIPTYTQ